MYGEIFSQNLGKRYMHYAMASHRVLGVGRGPQCSGWKFKRPIQAYTSNSLRLEIPSLQLWAMTVVGALSSSFKPYRDCHDILGVSR